MSKKMPFTSFFSEQVQPLLVLIAIPCPFSFECKDNKNNVNPQNLSHFIRIKHFFCKKKNIFLGGHDFLYQAFWVQWFSSSVFFSNTYHDFSSTTKTSISSSCLRLFPCFLSFFSLSSIFFCLYCFSFRFFMYFCKRILK